MRKSDKNPQLEKVYQFADLSKYPFKKRLLIRVADVAFYWLIRLIGGSARYEVEGWARYEAVINEGRVPIHTVWHDCIHLAIYFWQGRKIVYMASQSVDGEYIARFLQRFGFGATRGSSTRGGASALIEMVRLVRAGVETGFTLDGPRGPRHEAKMGAILLAKKTGQPIVPHYVTARRRWLVKSWDRLQIPRPFTPALMMIGEPIYVPPDADEATLEQKRAELQAALNQLVERGEQWRVG